MAQMTENEKKVGVATGRQVSVQLGWGDLSAHDLSMLLLCIIMSQKTELAEAFKRIEQLEGKPNG